MNRSVLALVLLAATSFAGKPPGIGDAITTEACVRVTLLSVKLLPEAELKGAAGGRLIQWLVEPTEGWPAPAWGDVRLYVDGKPWNTVVNATSSKPLAPDLIIDDARKLGFGADPLGGTVLSPGAFVATVLIRGAMLPPETHVETSIELGLFARGAKPKAGTKLKPRYVEFRARGP